MTTKIESEQPRVKRSELEMPVTNGTVTIVKVGDDVSAVINITKLKSKMYKDQNNELIAILTDVIRDLESELRYM